MQWIRVTPTEASAITSMDGDAFFDWLEEHEDRVVEVDKAWHGIHAVLTGTAWEVQDAISTAVLGGAEFGEDSGYGRPRLLQPQEVAKVAEALREVEPASFRERVDFRELERLDIYPSIWDRAEEHEELVEYLTNGFVAVRALFLDAAEHAEAVAMVCT